MKKKEEIDLLVKLIDRIAADYSRLDKVCNEALAIGTMDCNGRLYEAIWRSFDSMLDCIDEGGWIAWFIHENDLGEKKMEASPGKNVKLRPIKNSRDLAKIIHQYKNI